MELRPSLRFLLRGHCGGVKVPVAGCRAASSSFHDEIPPLVEDSGVAWLLPPFQLLNMTVDPLVSFIERIIFQALTLVPTLLPGELPTLRSPGGFLL